jgi:glycosyltransferase involved in cell wall biosynthesis
MERRLLGRRPYIYDFDDAFYLKYRSGRLGKLRPVLGNKFDCVIGGAAAVTAGNYSLQLYASALNPSCTFLPTVVDTTRYVAKARVRNAGFTVGWVGSPSTAPYLSELIEPLQQLGREGRVKFVVVGGKAPAIPGVEISEVKWDEDCEVDLINGFDVGVMPLPDDEWARGKCAFKLIQYMACGVPVIGSRVGANIDVVKEGYGFLANSADEWLQCFRRLRDNRDLAEDMGQDARKFIVEHYSLRQNLPVLAEIIRNVAKRQG